jgi:hypothetical protein
MPPKVKATKAHRSSGKHKKSKTQKLRPAEIQNFTLAEQNKFLSKRCGTDFSDQFCVQSALDEWFKMKAKYESRSASRSASRSRSRSASNMSESSANSNSSSDERSQYKRNAREGAFSPFA